jgi:flagellar biosynthetic protein FliR
VNGVLEQWGEQHAVGFILTLARIGPLFVLAPLFSSKMVPKRARVVIAVGLAIGMAQLSIGDEKVPTDVLSLGGLLLKEILVGFAFAFALAALFAAIATAGSFLDTLVGFSFGGTVDPINGMQTGVLTQLYSMVGVAIFVAIGGDAWVIRGLANSYEVLPMASLPDIGAMVGGAQELFSGIFISAVQVAAPVMLAVIITDCAFGVVSRVMPQLNVFAVGFPAKILIGFVLIGASLPFVAEWIGGQLTDSVRSALQTLQIA